jgi:hypothetical protein
VEIFNQINIKARNTCQEAHFISNFEVRSDYETTLSIRSNPKLILLFRNPNESDRIGFAHLYIEVMHVLALHMGLTSAGKP